MNVEEEFMIQLVRNLKKIQPNLIQLMNIGVQYFLSSLLMILMLLKSNTKDLLWSVKI